MRAVLFPEDAELEAAAAAYDNPSGDSDGEQAENAGCEEEEEGEEEESCGARPDGEDGGSAHNAPQVASLL